MELTLSADHRIVYGADAADFLRPCASGSSGPRGCCSSGPALSERRCQRLRRSPRCAAPVAPLVPVLALAMIAVGPLAPVLSVSPLAP